MSPIPAPPTPPSDAAPSLHPPLSLLLVQCASAVQAVREGQSLTDWLSRCPAPLRPAVQSLSFEALRRLGATLAVRTRLAPKTPAPRVDNLLLSALALLWPQSQPAYAAHTVVNQAVEAARQHAPKAAPFVNAVLRRFMREHKVLLPSVLEQPVARYNHPAWWIDKLQSDWGALAPALLQANNARAPMSLRVNARQSSAAHYLAQLNEVGLSARPLNAELLPHALLLEQPSPVQALPGFAQGATSVQDAAAQLAAPLLLGQLRPQQAQHWPILGAGARVLDACAAPGGKTAHLQELADNGLALLALDADAQRLQRVQDNLQRLQLQAQVKAADARDVQSWWDGQAFDAILLDAPCSASGIVRRHPDVRWLRRASDISALARVQSELLEALWPLLKPGGRLVYATCSVFKAEGQDQIDAFLQRHADASMHDVPGATGHLLPLDENDPLAPAALDGFFYALLTKSA
ncbi:16S rRNA (cytosine(967)-C(5))-methyltransferase RsmB [Roseateles sp. BYS180W]|uniref:16S rRNA (cytosine(967)-C(5))-methyltransferase n=1 Tax=Roseateles rivi TaxID=3299028 RepID=A0ABW7FTC1_9BURK